MLCELAGAAALCAWVYLLFGRGAFWRMRESDLGGAGPKPAPRVAVVMPARNEAAVIGKAAASLAAQEYPGELHLFVVDDHSEDGTADAARLAAASASLTVIPARPLPQGWTGKVWAMAEGVREATRIEPEYFLFTDADIVHPRRNVAGLIAQAARGGYDLTSLMVRLRCASLAERALVPAFGFFFFLLYPPAWIRASQRRVAGAAGGCMLVRRAALESIGGVQAIRGELIDDCALARLVKRSGGTVWLGLGGAESIREYGSFAAVGGMISRSAYTQLKHSVVLLAGTLVGMFVVYLAPPLIAFSCRGRAAALGAVAWLLMAIAFAPALRFHRRPVFWAPLLPGIAAFYAVATLHSAVQYWRGSGGRWKGRVQDGTRPD